MVNRDAHTGGGRRWWFRAGFGFLVLDLFGRPMITLVLGNIGVEG